MSPFARSQPVAANPPPRFIALTPTRREPVARAAKPAESGRIRQEAAVRGRQMCGILDMEGLAWMRQGLVSLCAAECELAGIGRQPQGPMDLSLTPGTD